MTDSFRPLRRALLSVSDKMGLVPLAEGLARHGVALIASGGTYRALVEAGLQVTELATYTGSPEMLDGRVKTLHPRIHGGILGRRDIPDHQATMAAADIPPIDLVVVNLYPFEATVAAGGDFAACVENIDIGGPALIRSAAKNHDGVVILTDPADYAAVLHSLDAHDGQTDLALRRRLAAKAFARTALYDSAIADWFAEQASDGVWPAQLSLSGQLSDALRYGENPHQAAAVYRTAEARPGVARARQLQGKELSYNNLNDTDAAYELVAEFDRPAVAIIKHANPCGVAQAADLATAYSLALRCDPVSAFGGIVAVNRPLDATAAEAMIQVFAEVIIAPEITDAAQAILAAKTNLRVLEAGALPDPAAAGQVVKSIAGGLLLQDRDAGRVTPDMLATSGAVPPSPQQIDDLIFAFRVCKHVKSNAIVFARDGATVGIGAGQMSRVDAVRIAAEKARAAADAAGLPETLTAGAVVASDAFFPFPDGLLAAADAGAVAAIHPGGSKRDQEVIAAADARGMALVTTGLRHFRH